MYVLNPDQLIDKLHQKHPNLKIDPDRKATIGLQMQPITESMKVVWMFSLLLMYGIILYKAGRGGGLNGNPMGDKPLR